MLIDWFTVLAQIVNFLVLLALLRRFLYGPLIAAIDAREKAIAATLAAADRKNQTASEAIAQLESRRADFEQSQAQILAAAREEADRRRGEMLQQARASVRTLETRWHDEMERDRAVFLDEMRTQAATEILAVTRQVLAGLAGADLETCALHVFLEQLRTIDPATLKIICAGPVSVVTPNDLPPDARAALTQTLESRLETPVHLQFETAPAMAWGIELRGGGQRLGWTPDSYLDSLEANLNSALDRGAAARCAIAA